MQTLGKALQAGLVSERSAQLLTQLVVAVQRRLRFGEHRVEHRRQLDHLGIRAGRGDRLRDRHDLEREIALDRPVDPMHQRLQTVLIKAVQPLRQLPPNLRRLRVIGLRCSPVKRLA